MYLIELNHNKIIKADSSQTILEAARAAGIGLEHSCRSGRCGVCRTLLRSGTTEVIKPEISLTDEDLLKGYILTCCRTATSDVELDADDLGRVGQIRAQTLPCKIDNIVLCTADIIEITLRLPPAAKFDFVPGQYVDVLGKSGLRRSYSIANAPRNDNKITLHIRKVVDGAMSRYWFEEAKQEDLLRIEGPLGTFSVRDSSKKNLILLATGTGIAPIKAILEDINIHQAKRFEKIDLYWGMRNSDEFYWHPTFDKLNFSITQVTSTKEPDDTSTKCYVQHAVVDSGVVLSECTAYACGSEIMIKDARELLISKGLDNRHYYSDAFVSSN